MNLAKTLITLGNRIPDSEIGDKISGGVLPFYAILTRIALPVAALFIAIAAFKLIFGSEQEANKAKSTMIRVIIGLAIIYAAPYLVATVGGWFQDFNSVWIW